MAPRVLLPLFLLAALVFFAAPAAAGTYVELDDEAGAEERIEREFRLREDAKLKLTVACREGQSGHVRIYFYERSRQGGWAEIDRLRIVLRDSTDPTSGEFELPRGAYKMVVSVRRMEYAVKLEDAPDE